jgi:perosamine synthetase
MNSNLPQMEPWFGPEEGEALSRYMSTGGWLTEFKNTQAFEQALAEFCGARHCIVVTSGTTALMAAMMAMGVGPDDEVIVPNYTMIASPNSVLCTGAKPVFADVERETLCLDIRLAEAAVTERTRAIMLVNANGREPSSGIKAFEDLANRHGVILMEDACQALGCWYRDGRHAGTATLVGTLSFSVPKIITTGQGGALLTNDDDFAAKLRRVKDFGRARGGLDIHDTIGYNFKFTEMQAVVGLEQMKKLHHRLELKKHIYRRYADNLAAVEEVHMFGQDLSLTSPWFIDICAKNRAGLIEHLRANGIGSRTMYPPINKQVAYQVPGEHPVSNWVGEEGLWLPSATQLSYGDIDRVTDCIKDYYAKLRH